MSWLSTTTTVPRRIARKKAENGRFYVGFEKWKWVRKVPDNLRQVGNDGLWQATVWWSWVRGWTIVSIEISGLTPRTSAAWSFNFLARQDYTISQDTTGFKRVVLQLLSYEEPPSTQSTRPDLCRSLIAGKLKDHRLKPGGVQAGA